jgi:hypothetical protein
MSSVSKDIEITSHVAVIDRILTAAPASLCRSERELVHFPALTSCARALHVLNAEGITGAPVYRTKIATPSKAGQVGGAVCASKCL